MNGRLKGDPLDYEKYYLKFGVQITDDESLYEKSQIYWKKFYEAIFGSEENMKFLKKCTEKMII